MMNPNLRWASVAYLLLISMSKLLPWEITTAGPPDGAARDLSYLLFIISQIKFIA